MMANEDMEQSLLWGLSKREGRGAQGINGVLA